jgi:hypothetical protein
VWKMQTFRRTIVGCMLIAAAPVAAADPSTAWGTASASMGGGGSIMASANFQNTEMKNAQMVTMGKNVTIINNTINTCGSCTYYSITGNDNSIADNSVVSTNNGKLQNEGAITTFFATSITPENSTGAVGVVEATTSGQPAVFAGPR